MLLYVEQDENTEIYINTAIYKIIDKNDKLLQQI